MEGQTRPTNKLKFVESKRKIKVENKIVQPHYKLVAAANKHNLTLIGCEDNTIKYVETSQLFDFTSTQPQVISQPATPLVSLTFRPTLLSVARYGYSSILLVAGASSFPRCPVIEVYDLDSRSTIDRVNLNDLGDTDIIDYAWHPNYFESIVALCTSKGQLLVLAINKQDKGIGIVYKNEQYGALTCCWSMKGKNLAVGTRQGHILRLEPVVGNNSFTFKEVSGSNITFLNPKITADHQVVRLRWINSKYLIATHAKPNNPTGPETVYSILTVKPGKPYLYWTNVNFENTTGSNYTVHIANLSNSVVCISSATGEAATIGVLGANEATTNELNDWSALIVEEEGTRIELPLDSNNEETHPCGLTMTTLPPDGRPIVIFYTSDGLICPYAAMHSDNILKFPEHMNQPEQTFTYVVQKSAMTQSVFSPGGSSFGGKAAFYQAPTFGEKAPMFSVSGLTSSLGAPAFAAAAPTFGEKAPTFSASGLTSSLGAPAFAAAAPTFGEKAPTFSASGLTSSLGAPAFAAAAPTFGEKAPTFSASGLTSSLGAPAFAAAAPTFGEKAPTFSLPALAPTVSAAPTGGSGPTFGEKAPIFSLSGPAPNMQAPATGTPGPVFGEKAPTFSLPVLGPTVSATPTGGSGPTFGEKAPIFSLSGPAPNMQAPATGTPATFGEKAPIFSLSGVASSMQAPATGTPGPVFGQKAPTSGLASSTPAPSKAEPTLNSAALSNVDKLIKQAKEKLEFNGAYITLLDDLNHLRDKFDETLDIHGAHREAIDAVKEDIDRLDLEVLETFYLIEYFKSRLDFKKKSIDPITTKKVNNIKMRLKQIGVKLDELNDHVDLAWEDFVRRRSNKDRRTITLDGIYKALATNQKIINVLKKKIDIGDLDTRPVVKEIPTVKMVENDLSKFEEFLASRSVVPVRKPIPLIQ